MIINFHGKLISGPVRKKKIKTCHKKCNILIADRKIQSRTMSDRDNREECKQQKERRLTRFVSTIVMSATRFSSQLIKASVIAAE